MARIALAAAATLGMAVAAGRLETALHELLGHLGTAWLFGARPAWVAVTLLGGGGARSEWPRAPTPFEIDAVALGGIVVNAACGAVALVALWRRAPGGAGDLFLRVFAATSVFGAVHYLVAGSYYGSGDSAVVPRAWLPGLVAALPAFLLALRPLAAWTAARVGPRAFLPVVALAALGYAGLFVLLQQDFAALRARSVAVERAVAEARAEKAARIATERAAQAKALEARGEPVPEALRRPPRGSEVEVAPAEVREPFPIEVPLGACYLAAALLAARVRREPGKPIGAREAIVGAAIALIALAAVWPLRHGVDLAS